MPLVAQPQLEGEIGPDPDRILNEECRGALIDAVPSLPKRDPESVGNAGEERSDGWKVEGPCAFAEVLVEEMAVFPADLHRVPTTHVAERIGEDVRGVIPSDRKVWRSAEDETTGNEHLRQPDRTHDTALDSEVGRIQLRNGVVRGQQRAPAEPRFVERRSKDMRVVDRQNATPIRQQPAEPGDTRAVPTRFDRADPLVSVERVEPIVAADVLPKVKRPAVRIDRGRCEPHESRRAVSIDDVRAGDQLNQSANDGIGRGGALVIAQHEAAHVEALTLSQSLVCGEEEHLLTTKGPAQGRAELVALERVRFRRQLEEVAGVERVVPEVFERLSPELVGA